MQGKNPLAQLLWSEYLIRGSGRVRAEGQEAEQYKDKDGG